MYLFIYELRNTYGWFWISKRYSQYITKMCTTLKIVIFITIKEQKIIKEGKFPWNIAPKFSASLWTIEKYVTYFSEHGGFFLYTIQGRVLRSNNISSREVKDVRSVSSEIYLVSNRQYRQEELLARMSHSKVFGASIYHLQFCDIPNWLR